MRRSIIVMLPILAITLVLFIGVSLSSQVDAQDKNTFIRLDAHGVLNIIAYPLPEGTEKGYYLPNADISNVNLIGVDFSSAILSYSDLSKSFLLNADLSNASLQEARLVNADLMDFRKQSQMR